MKTETERLENEIQTKANIILAIETKNTIAFSYTKDIGFEGIRKVFPHNLYWNKDNSKLLLDAYQIEGDSRSDKVKSFKQFDTAFIKDCIILDESFEIQKGYNKDSNRYVNSCVGIL